MTLHHSKILILCTSDIQAVGPATHSRMAFFAALWQISVMSAPEYPWVALASISMLTSSATGDCSFTQKNKQTKKRIDEYTPGASDWNTNARDCDTLSIAVGGQSKYSTTALILAVRQCTRFKSTLCQPTTVSQNKGRFD